MHPTIEQQLAKDIQRERLAQGGRARLLRQARRDETRPMSKRYPAVVNVAAVAIVRVLCLLTGPLGGLRLRRLLAAEVARHQQEGALA